MASTNRSTLLTKIHKVLKKQYKVIAPTAERSVFEHLLFACCLENAHYDKAEEALAALQETFFDWNEVRVSTTKELADVMPSLPEPLEAGQRVKRVLQSIFEANYSFNLEGLQKQNLGQAQQRLKKYDGTTPFAIAYVTQAALGGHAVPIDAGALGALLVLGAIDEKEHAQQTVPGLERAIAKSKGIEFGSLLHQLSADFILNPYAPALHKLLLQINPECKDRLPKKLTKKQLEAQATAQREQRQLKKKAAASKAASEKSRPTKKTEAKRPAKAAETAKRKKQPAAAMPKRKPR